MLLKISTTQIFGLLFILFSVSMLLIETNDLSDYLFDKPIYNCKIEEIKISTNEQELHVTDKLSEEHNNSYYYQTDQFNRNKSYLSHNQLARRIRLGNYYGEMETQTSNQDPNFWSVNLMTDNIQNFHQADIQSNGFVGYTSSLFTTNYLKNIFGDLRNIEVIAQPAITKPFEDNFFGINQPLFKADINPDPDEPEGQPLPLGDGLVEMSGLVVLWLLMKKYLHR